MKILKGFALAVLHFLLFVSLIVFGFVFLVNSTVLNPRFVTAQIDRLDISGLVQEAVESDTAQDGMSAEIESSLVKTISLIEPELKKQVDAAVFRVYDYLRGETEEEKLADVLSSTVASNDFLVAVVNGLDFGAMARSFPGQGGAGSDGLPKEFTNAITGTITKQESRLKVQLGEAISPVNDYLWGRTQTLHLATVLGDTVLTREFIAGVVNDLDIKALATGFINEQFVAAVPAEYQFLTKNVDVGDVAAKLEPWIKEQATTATGPVLDYLLGRAESVDLAVSLQPALLIVKDTLKASFMASPPLEFAFLSREELGRQFEQVFAQFAESTPTTLLFNERDLASTRDSIGRSLAQAELRLKEARDSIATNLAEVDDNLAIAKKYVGYVRTAYLGLIGLMIVLVLGIVFIHRRVKSAARTLGVTLLPYGVVVFTGVMVAKSLVDQQIQKAGEIPEQLLVWLSQFVRDFIAPLQTFSLGILVLGVVLLIISFVYGRRRKERSSIEGA